MTDPYYQKDAIGEDYDRILDFPIIRAIRKQESNILLGLFHSTIQPGDTVLEVGAGTGYYSFEMAALAKSLVTLEPSEPMVRILQKKVHQKEITGLEIIQTDFFEFHSSQKFDHVVAIGVLDYVKDWQKFIGKCLELSRKSVILSVPQKGLWSSFYKFLGIFSTRIYNFSREEIVKQFPQYDIVSYEVGLKSRFVHGLTLILKITK